MAPTISQSQSPDARPVLLAWDFAREHAASALAALAEKVSADAAPTQSRRIRPMAVFKEMPFKRVARAVASAYIEGRLEQVACIEIHSAWDYFVQFFKYWQGSATGNFAAAAQGSSHMLPPPATFIVRRRMLHWMFASWV